MDVPEGVAHALMDRPRLSRAQAALLLVAAAGRVARATPEDVRTGYPPGMADLQIALTRWLRATRPSQGRRSAA